MTNAEIREKAAKDVLQAAVNLRWIQPGDSMKELREYLERIVDRRRKGSGKG